MDGHCSNCGDIKLMYQSRLEINTSIQYHLNKIPLIFGQLDDLGSPNGGPRSSELRRNDIGPTIQRCRPDVTLIMNCNLGKRLQKLLDLINDISSLVFSEKEFYEIFRDT